MKNKKPTNTIKVTMQFTREELLKMDDASLLRIVIAFAQANTAFGPNDYVAGILGVSSQTITNYLAGKGQPGIRQWKAILRETKLTIIQAWLEAHVKGGAK